jgi:DNA-binding NarL/FixJ family response regulator
VDVLRPVLEEMKIQLEHCEDLSESETRLEHKRFEVVILDFARQLEAATILKHIRSAHLNSKTLVVALVGPGNDVRQIFALGTNFVLYKPISEERARSSLQAARSLMRRERRRSPRVAVYTKASLDYATVEKAQATLLDLSEEGVAVQSERKLPPSCKVYFQFNLPANPMVVRLSAELVWQDSAGRVGLRFVDVPQSSRRILRDWLRENLAKSSESSHVLEPSPPSAPQPKTSGHSDDGLARLRASPGNRRGPARHTCRLGADVFRLGGSVPHRCSLSDISAGGCYIETPSPFPPGEAVEILVRTADLKVRVEGVVQATHPGFGMGVQFTLKSTQDRDQVQHLIRLLAESAHDTGVSAQDLWR